MSNLDFYDGGRLVRVPVPLAPLPTDLESVEEVEEDCIICGFSPCECDRIYDTWKERDL